MRNNLVIVEPNVIVEYATGDCMNRVAASSVVSAYTICDSCTIDGVDIYRYGSSHPCAICGKKAD